MCVDTLQLFYQLNFLTDKKNYIYEYSIITEAYDITITITALSQREVSDSLLVYEASIKIQTGWKQRICLVVTVSGWNKYLSILRGIVE